MVETLQQGDVFWIDGIGTSFIEVGGRRPVVVVQGNGLNESRLRTVIVCPLMSNTEWAADMGNVLLELGEGNLSKRSVVNVSQFYTLDKERLAEYIRSFCEGNHNFAAFRPMLRRLRLWAR